MAREGVRRPNLWWFLLLDGGIVVLARLVFSPKAYQRAAEMSSGGLPSPSVLRGLLAATAVIHAAEAVAAGRIAARRGLPVWSWRRQTFVVGFPSLLALRKEAATLTAWEEVDLGGRKVGRMGFGAMQLPGPGVFGPPKDRATALEILRRVVEAGVNHVDTAQFYGPDVANDLIREALYPYPDDLVLVSKVGAFRDDVGGWIGAQRPEELRQGVEANLASLRLEQVPVVNLRRHPEAQVPFDEQVAAMVAMREEGMIGAVGLSTVTLDEYRRARDLTGIACVQNAYSVADRSGQDVFDACRCRRGALRPVLPARLGLHARPAGAHPPGGTERGGSARGHAGAGGPGVAAPSLAQRVVDPRDVVASAPRGEPGRGRRRPRRGGPHRARLSGQHRTGPNQTDTGPNRSGPGGVSSPGRQPRAAGGPTMPEADSDRSPRVTRRAVAFAVAGCTLVLGATALAVALGEAGGASPASASASRGCGASTSRLTVQGTGQATGTPDLLNAVFGFNTTAGSSTAALSENNAKVTQALAALAASGVATRDVQTTGLSLSPQYAYPHGVPTLTGYQVTDTVNATLRDVTKAGSAIDAVVGAAGDAAQIEGLDFSIVDPAKVQDEARAQAVHLAVAHAEAMAAAAGRGLGPVCSLTDNTQPRQEAPFSNAGFGQAASAPTSAVPVQPGTQLETDQVTLVYALVPRGEKG